MNETPKAKPKHGKPSGRSVQDLRPLPMRISQRAYQRLERIRDIDGLTIQEHVRRGLDYYLDHLELSVALSASAGLDSAVIQVKDNSKLAPNKIVPDLLAKHAPRAVRPSAPKVVVK